MKKLQLIFLILITGQFSTAQFLDSMRVVNKQTLTPYVHSNDTVGVKVWGTLSSSGFYFDTSYIAVSGNTIIVTIIACHTGSIDIPTITKFNTNLGVSTPLPEGNYVAKARIYTYIPMNNIACSSLTFKDSLTTSFIISDVASVKESSSGERILIYPNPTSNKLHLESVSEFQSINLTNVLGQKVMEIKVESKTIDIDLSSLPKGIYFLNTQAYDIKRKSYKVIKD